MRFLVIFQTLLTAAIAAKLPTYSLPTLHQHQSDVGTPLPVTSSRPNDHTIQDHVGQNGPAHIHEPTGPQLPQQPHGTQAQTGLTHTFGEPTRPQEPFHFQDATDHDAFIQTFGEPVGSPLTFVTPTEPNNVNQIYEEPTAPFGHTQHHSSNGQSVFIESTVEPQRPKHTQGHTGPVHANRCLQGEVLHADGSCVVPEVTRDLYVFSIPEAPRRPIKPIPTLPPPRVHEHVMFIRTPEDRDGRQPLLVPPPSQKSVVYILRKESPEEEHNIIQAPAPPPVRPEVFFVNYEDGDNPSLHGGLDLHQVLQTVTSAPPSQQEVSIPVHVEEALEEHTYSQLESHIGGDLVLDDQSDENLTLGDYSNDGIFQESHDVATSDLGDHTNGNLQHGDHINGNLQHGDHINGNLQHGDHTNGNLQYGGHTNGNLQHGDHINGNFALRVLSEDLEFEEHLDHDLSLEDLTDDTFVLRHPTDDDISLESNTDDQFVLRGHRQGGLVLGSQGNNGLGQGETNSIALSVQRSESAGQGLSNVQETFADAPIDFGFQSSGVLRGDQAQEGGNGGYAVPARLLGVTLGSRHNFNGFVDSEEAARSVVDTVTDTVAEFSDNLYGPPTTSTTTPSLRYTQP